jgi:hypothetical protein
MPASQRTTPCHFPSDNAGPAFRRRLARTLSVMMSVSTHKLFVRLPLCGNKPPLFQQDNRPPNARQTSIGGDRRV